MKKTTAFILFGFCSAVILPLMQNCGGGFAPGAALDGDYFFNTIGSQLPIDGSEAAINMRRGKVAQLFQAKCASCHGADPLAPPANILDTGELIKQGWIIPGRPDQSKLFLSVTTEVEVDRMPPGPNALSKDETMLIANWIYDFAGSAGGAPPPGAGGGTGPQPTPTPGGMGPSPTPGSMMPTPTPTPGGMMPTPTPTPGGMMPTPTPTPVPGGMTPAPTPMPTPMATPAPTPMPTPVPTPMPTPVPGNPNATFSYIRKTVIQNHCLNCHGNAQAKATLNFNTHAGVMKAVVAKMPGRSAFYTTLSGDRPSMPPQNTNLVSTSDAKAVYDWIMAGAPNN